LGIFGIIAFAFGIIGSVMSKRKKHFALTMITVCFPLIENTTAVKYSFDNYQLPIPWIAITLALMISTISGVLIGKSDKEFI
jgi:CHASE2 domain-containing sensor protein